MIEYRHSNSQADVVDYVAKLINQHLAAGDRVLWLTSGGSNIILSAQIASKLATDNSGNLYVSLVDERYGELGHPDENWQQLLDAGFEIKGAHPHRPLTGDSGTETASKFGQWLVEQINLADISIGLLGIGSDGHTAGIKPHSSAVQSRETAVYYNWDDHQRITMTPAAIVKLDVAVIQAFGRDKDDTLHKLLTLNLPDDDQPAQVLKRVNRSILYTDYKEEES